MLARMWSSNRVVHRGVVLGALLGLAYGLTAAAQPGPGGGALTPEDRAKANTAEATAVAADMKLDAEKSGKLAEAYVAFQKESAENRPDESVRGDREAMRKYMDEREAKLVASLTGFLDEAQAKQAADILAGFNRGWDQMVLTILGFGLDEAKTAEALGHTLAYVKAGAKAREEAAASGSFDNVRTAMAAAKKTLDDSLAPMLSEEQKAEWAAKTARGPRGGGERRDRGADGGAGAPTASPAPGAATPEAGSANERRDRRNRDDN